MSQKTNLYGILMVLGVAATIHTAFAPRSLQAQSTAEQQGAGDAEAPEQETANRWIVETRLRVDGRWYRLNSGPRNAKEACILWHGMRRMLEREGLPHAFTFIDMVSGEAKTPDAATVWPFGVDY